MKAKKTHYPTKPLDHILNPLAWVLMCLSLIGIVVTSIVAVSQANQDFQDSLPWNRHSGSYTTFQPDDANRPTNTPNENNRPDDTNVSQPPAQAPSAPDQFSDVYYPELGNPRLSVHIAIPYIIILVLCALIFSLSGIYLIMSAIQSDFYRNPDRTLILILATTLTTIILSTLLVLVNNFSIDTTYEDPCPQCDSTSSREETEFDKDNIANSEKINLDSQTSDLTITKPGTYTLTGSFAHSVIVDAADADVKLILNGITITNPSTATIVGLAANKITISTTKDSVNTLTDGGKSIYDGCIFSNAELIFEGEGTLIVNGEQTEGEGIATEAKPITFNGGTYRITSADDGINAGGDGDTITINDGTFYIDASGDGIDSNKNAIINGGTIFVIGSDTGGDAGIDTDAGFAINGGTVVALGSSMLETPLTSSEQLSFTATLSQSISKDTPVALLDDSGKTIISFSAPKSFRTVVISTPELKSGTTYTISASGTHTGTLVDGIYANGTYYTGGNKVTTKAL